MRNEPKKSTLLVTGRQSKRSNALVPIVETETKRTLPPVLESFKWKKGGPSPNPNGSRGRVQGVLSAPLLKKMGAKVPGDKKGRRYGQAIIDTMADSAVAGNLKAAHEIFERLEGKPGGNDGNATGGDTTINLAFVQQKEIFKE